MCHDLNLNVRFFGVLELLRLKHRLTTPLDEVPLRCGFGLSPRSELGQLWPPSASFRFCSVRRNTHYPTWFPTPRPGALGVSVKGLLSVLDRDLSGVVGIQAEHPSSHAAHSSAPADLQVGSLALDGFLVRGRTSGALLVHESELTL